jgi:hypothetical protein
VKLSLYDVAGRLVAEPLNATMQGGEAKSIIWSAGAEVLPGLYWWCLRTGGHELQRPLVIAR